LTKVHTQLRARFVYDADSVTDIAARYFETISWKSYDTLRARPTPSARAVQAAARAARRVKSNIAGSSRRRFGDLVIALPAPSARIYDSSCES
jgi:hypothetical protein